MVSDKTQDEAFDTALAAINHAQSMTVPAGDNFLQNLQNIAINEAFLPKQKGFAAYIVQHYLTYKAREAEADSSHIGTVGKRHVFTGTVKHVSSHEGFHGYYRIVRFVDDAGNALTWFCTSDIDIIPGETYSVTGTVKKHDNYKGQAQTIINRCKLAA